MISRQQGLHETMRRLTSLSTVLVLPAVHTIQHTCWTRGQFQFHLTACVSRNSIPMLDREPQPYVLHFHFLLHSMLGFRGCALARDHRLTNPNLL
jgi:hypothetical protein